MPPTEERVDEKRKREELMLVAEVADAMFFFTEVLGMSYVRAMWATIYVLLSE